MPFITTHLQPFWKEELDNGKGKTAAVVCSSLSVPLLCPQPCVDHQANLPAPQPAVNVVPEEADMPNSEQGCGSPLELFHRIAAQGELVRGLKARNAAKVGHFATPPQPCLSQSVGQCHLFLFPHHLRDFGSRIKCIFSLLSIDACGLKGSRWEAQLLSTLPLHMSCSQKQPLSILLADSFDMQCPHLRITRHFAPYGCSGLSFHCGRQGISPLVSTSHPPGPV